MSYELSGKLIEKFDTVNISDSFKKREFVVETSKDYNGRVFSDQIKMQLVQDKCNLLDNLNVNDEVKVAFNIRGKRYEKDGKVNYFNNLDAWKIESLGQTEFGNMNQERDESNFNQDNNSNVEDDLPF